MTNRGGNSKSRPALATIDAIDIIVDCLTPRDLEVLKLERNGQVITAGHQMLARGGNFIPLPDHQMIFRAEAMKLIDKNRHYLDLIEKAKKDDIFAALLDPENYKDKTKMVSKGKNTGKKQSLLGSTAANVTKSLSRMTQGDAAVGVTGDYGTIWDLTDRQRLDKLKIETSKDTPLINTNAEKEEGDDTIELSTDVKEESLVDKKERLDYKNIEKAEVPMNSVSFGKSAEGVPDEKNILLHTAHIMHNSGANTNERAFGANAFVENLKRHNTENVKEQLKLAEALYRIQNIEFSDIREMFYKGLDCLFYARKKTCHL